MKKWFGDLKIGLKIALSFLVVGIFATLVGFIGLKGIFTVGNSYTQVYQDTVAALECVKEISTNFEAMRKNLYNVTLSNTKADKDAAISDIKQQHDVIREQISIYNSMLDKYRGMDIESIKILDQIEAEFNKFYEGATNFLNSPAALDNSRQSEAIYVLSTTGKLNINAIELNKYITELFNFNKNYAVDQLVVNRNLINNSAFWVIGILVIGIILALLVGKFISRRISKPINEIVDVSTKLANGDFNIEIESNSKDETGILAQEFKRMSYILTTIIDDLKCALDSMAHGDFTVDSKVPDLYINGFKPLYNSIYELIISINETMSQINNAADQVSTGSSQVSSGAQALSSGSTEQAASIEELSAAIEKISEQIKENSEIINSSAIHVQKTEDDVEAGNQQMAELIRAMEEIEQASNQIANITKAIEDIAFQTNILALNAAIEAARAGNAGKGFAVVADEVRALAAKSGEAAKQTTELINASVLAVAKGTELTTQTAQVLQNVGVNSKKVVNSFEDIKKSSYEQSMAIGQIKEGIFQISAVTQTNAANAEENSATSEEMSSQAIALVKEVEKFKLKENLAIR